MNFKKSAIVIYEKIKENITAIIAKKFNSALPSLKILYIPKRLAAVRVGIDKKKEIFAESNLLNPNNLPEVMVTPDLLTPGIKEKTWNKPIKIADLLVNDVLIFFVIFDLSLIYRKIPNIKLIHPITSKFLSWLINPVW